MGYFNRGNQFGSPAAPVVWGQAAANPIQFAGDPDYAIMGACEIMGDPTASLAAKSLAMQTLATGGQVVGQKTPRLTYSQTLPCTSLAIAASATENRDINLQPQRPFRPENSVRAPLTRRRSS